jgi:hypothetical protein
MPEIPVATAIAQIQAVLREAFEGADRGSYFIDHGPGTGYLAMLGALSPEEASRAAGGSSIASHVHHLVFSLEASIAWIMGDRGRRNWKESWAVQTVDAGQWDEMRRVLAVRYRALQEAIASHATTDEEAVGGAIGVVAHMAYHLGAIRQKLLIGGRP